MKLSNRLFGIAFVSMCLLFALAAFYCFTTSNTIGTVMFGAIYVFFGWIALKFFRR